MFENYAGVKVLKLFLENPYSKYYLREIAKKAKVSPSTAKIVTDFLVEKGLIVRSVRGNLAIFKANMSNPTFKHMKITKSLFEIWNSGIIPLLTKQCKAQSITLYGGVARGEDDENSDIDILVIGKEKPTISYLSTNPEKTSEPHQQKWFF